MKKIVCFFIPVIIGILIFEGIIFLKERKNRPKIIKLVFLYFFNLIVDNFFMFVIIIAKFGHNFFTYNYFNKSFYLKYACIVVCLSFFFSYVFNLLKDKYLLLRDNKIFEIKFNKDKAKKYFLSKKSIVDVLFFFGLCVFNFFLIDFFIRLLSVDVSTFGSVFLISSNIFTLSFAILFASIIYYLPSRVSYAFLIFLNIFWIIMYVVNYFLLNIKKEAFSLYDLTNTGEGFSYLNFIYDKISFEFILKLLLLLALTILCIVYLHKVHKNNLKKNYLSFIKLLILCFILFISGVLFLDSYEENSWDEVTKSKYYYDNFVNPKKSLSVLGIYEYTFRDIHLYIKNKHDTYGSIEEIEAYIDKYPKILKNNEYTGIFKDKNLIMIMMESIDEVAVNSDAMPTLTYMRNNGWNFTKRYNALNGGGSTIMTEYVSMTSLLYHTNYYTKINDNYYPYSLPNMFNSINYKTISVHENNGVYYNRDRLHPILGINNSYFLSDILDDKLYYNDAQIIDNNQIYDLVIPKDEKFMTFMITIAAHGPYDNTNGVCHEENANFTEKECLYYLAGRTDNLLSSLLNRLKEDNILDDTVIILYTDHIAYSYNYTQEDLKIFEQVDKDKVIKNIPFIIYSTDIIHNDFNMLVNDADFVPTILNLFGIDYNPNNYVGTDVFSKEHKDLIMFLDYSFYDGKIYSRNEDVDITSSDYIEKQQYVNDTLNFSQMIISNNYYKK